MPADFVLSGLVSAHALDDQFQLIKLHTTRIPDDQGQALRPAKPVTGSRTASGFGNRRNVGTPRDENLELDLPRDIPHIRATTVGPGELLDDV